MPVENTAERLLVKLVAEDGPTVELSIEAAKLSGMVGSILQAGNPHENIPVNVNANVLEKCVEYMNQYVNRTPREIPKPLPPAPLNEVIEEWDAKFISSMETTMIFKLILAANYLDVPGLLDLCCAKVASDIRGKTVEEIRKTFGIINDFTPEEEAQIREENRWCDPE